MKAEIEAACRAANDFASTNKFTDMTNDAKILAGFVECMWDPMVKWTKSAATLTRDWLISEVRKDIKSEKKKQLEKLDITEQLVWSYFAVGTGAGAAQQSIHDFFYSHDGEYGFITAKKYR